MIIPNSYVSVSALLSRAVDAPPLVLAPARAGGLKHRVWNRGLASKRHQLMDLDDCGFLSHGPKLPELICICPQSASGSGRLHLGTRLVKTLKATRGVHTEYYGLSLIVLRRSQRIQRYHVQISMDRSAKRSRTNSTDQIQECIRSTP